MSSYSIHSYLIFRQSISIGFRWGGTNRLASLSEALPPDTVYYDSKTYSSGQLKSDGKVYRTITVEGSTTAEAGTSPELRANESITLKPNFHAKAGSGFHARWVNEPNYEIKDDNASFTYDEIGNLIADSSEGTTISWTPYGKVRQVSKTDGTTVTYRYDGTGNRVEKKVVASDSSYTTRYIRDASGNVLAIYQDSVLTEQPIYGSSRLGMYKGGTEKGKETLGNRRFELGNHLGNVLAVITDNINMDADSTWATVESLQDYFAFGMVMEGRDWQSESYRFGFQGQEKNGETGTIHFKYREHDPKIGRFWSVDPLADQFSGWSPYAFGLDNPLRYIDPDGRAPFDATGGDPCPGCQVAMQQLGREVGALQRSIENAYYKASNAFDRTIASVKSVVTGDNVRTVGNTSDIIEVATDRKVTNSANQALKTINNTTKVLGPAADAASIIVDAANTDFDDPQQVNNFVQNTAGTAVEAVSGPIAPFVNIMNDNAKKPDGLLNLSNERMSNSFSTVQNAQQQRTQERINRLREANRPTSANEDENR